MKKFFMKSLLIVSGGMLSVMTSCNPASKDAGTSGSNESDDASVVADIVAAQLEAQKEAERLEAERQDSIRQDSIRQDSIFKAIVPKMSYFVNNKSGYPLYNDVKQINKKLKSLGYSSKESKSYIEGYYDEAIDEYIEPHYAYNYVWTLDSPISVNIVAKEEEIVPFMKMTISDNKALQEFIQSLSAAGFRKGGSNAMGPYQGGVIYTHPKSEYWALCQVEVVGNTVYFNYLWCH